MKGDLIMNNVRQKFDSRQEGVVVEETWDVTWVRITKSRRIHH